jgi:hypothetical protein
MKTLNKGLFVPLVLALSLLVMMALPAMSLAAEATVPLGTTSTFGVLAGSTITNTGPTTIGGSAGGDVGVSPGSAFTGRSSVTLSGAVHLADAVALKAQKDLVTAYDSAAGRTPTTIASQLDGQHLSPGVYNSLDGTFNLAVDGTLTLDGAGVYIFQTASTLVMESGSTVSLINGAVPCRVFWKVGSSATLGTDSHFVGHIFALTSIKAQTGATVQGQLLARNGAVTLDHNTIANGICTTGPAINVVKTATPRALTSGPGSVTYTYFVTNPGTVDLSNVVVTDNKLSPVKYVSGDVNHDNLLQPSEIWIYTAKGHLTSTTTNVATARGITEAGAPVSATGSTRVVVSTVTGGELPTTATPWYNLLLVGVALTFVGALGWWRTTRKIHE